ncbi:ABC transporter permease [Mesorhizobium loti]|uniref:ABC transporter permease n=1 Tax=Rhizobium loti TaxID=381 RepID=UPI000428AB4B|nr:ABC transporter permease [Mesorhizobium loti]
MTAASPAAMTDLRAGLRRAERRRQVRAFGLVTPLLAFMLAIFVLPIASTLLFSISSTEMKTALPRTTAALANWSGDALPDETTYAALAADLAQGYAAKTVAGIATRLNQEIPGLRSLVMQTARKAETLPPPYRAAFAAVDPRWEDVATWRAMKSAAGPLTPRYLLQVLDLEREWDGSIVSVAPDRAVYITYLTRTFWMSIVVTLLCVAIGYPLAFYAAHCRPFARRLVLGSVLLPFLVSVLVRTAAWIVVLQKNGIVNSLLVWLGIVDQPVQLIFDRFGVYVVMVHVLLPFLVLPLYSVMRTIPALHMRAASSLGATPLSAFLSVYLPQSLPGLGAGAMLVFILSLGYYTTPALVGGPGDQMLSSLVTEFALEIGNWGMASAAATLLLISTLVSYLTFSRLFRARGFLP